MTSYDEPTLISNLNNNRPTGVRPNFYAEYALRIRTEHQDILSDLLAPAIASFRHENSDWLRTSFDELKCIVDEVYLRVYPSLDIALDTRGARKEAERQRQLQIENEKKEQLLREAAAKDLAEKAEKERKEALINKQLSVLEEKRQKTLAQYKTRLEAELPNQSYWYWFVRTLLRNLTSCAT